MSTPGKDGRDGAVGQAGADGAVGRAGTAGHAGEPGVEGPAGPRGERGQSTEAIKLTDRRVLAGFVIMMSIFVFLGWRIQVNAEEIRRNTDAQCQRSITNTTKINATNAATLAYLRAGPQTPDVARLEAIFVNAVLVVPTCTGH